MPRATTTISSQERNKAYMRAYARATSKLRKKYAKLFATYLEVELLKEGIETEYA